MLTSAQAATGRRQPDVLRELSDTLRPYGLTTRGAFHPKPEDGGEGVMVRNRVAGTLVLVGNVGGAMWSAFSAMVDERKRADEAHPLDDWTRSVVDPVAAEFGAIALYPFGGPPHVPFQRWAMRAAPVHESPLGLLIDPQVGLWHAYRAALVFPDRLPLAERERDRGAHPCETCEDTPCLSACPVNAIRRDRYDVPGCVSHVRSAAGGDCRDFGCRARRACPIAPEVAYPAEQGRFHIGKFLSAAERSPRE